MSKAEALAGPLPPAPPPPPGVEGPPIPGDPGLASLVPFGLDHPGPSTHLGLLGALWRGRRELGWAARILREGICDGCGLAERGLRDTVTGSFHLCTQRLDLLRQHTGGAVAPAWLVDLERLGTLSATALRDLGRLPYPFVRRRGRRGFERLTWEAALELVGNRLGRTDPERTFWFASDRAATNEAYYTLAKSARLLGAGGLDSSGRLALGPSEAALAETLGFTTATCTVEDVIGTDLLLVWGAELARSHPELLRVIAHAKRAGTRVVAINVALEPGLRATWPPLSARWSLFGARIADDELELRPGGDQALALAVVGRLLAWGRVDQGFVDDHTEGLAAVRATLAALPDEVLLARAGASADQATWLARLVSRARSMVSLWGSGLTRQPRAATALGAIVDLHLVRGLVGRPRCGLLPLAPRSGSLGAVDCGMSPSLLPGRRPADEAGAAALTAAWGHPVALGTRRSLVDAVAQAEAGGLDVLYDLAGDLPTALPDPDRVRAAFGRVPLRIHQATHLDPSMLWEVGEELVVLPACSRYDQPGGGTVTSMDRLVRFGPELPGAPWSGEARPAWSIPPAVAVAARPELAAALRFADAQAVREDMAAAMPIYAGVHRLGPGAGPLRWGGRILGQGGSFPRPEGRARIAGRPLDAEPRPAAARELVGLPRAHPDDAVVVWASIGDAAGLDDGAAVSVRSDRGELRGTLRWAELRRGHVQLSWPACAALFPLVLGERGDAPSLEVPVSLAPGDP